MITAATATCVATCTALGTALRRMVFRAVGCDLAAAVMARG